MWKVIELAVIHVLLFGNSAAIGSSLLVLEFFLVLKGPTCPKEFLKYVIKPKYRFSKRDLT
jgi:hypothetical protein